jgi:hypothetical protein
MISSTHARPGAVSLHISKYPSFKDIHQTGPDWRDLARGTVDFVYCESKYADNFLHGLLISSTQ